MTINAISGIAGVGSIQPDQPSASRTDAAPTATPAQPLPTGAHPPLTPALLALLVGEQLALYGTSSIG